MAALLARNLQVVHSDLAAHVTPSTLPQLARGLAMHGQTGAAIATIDAGLNQQAAMIAYIDDFHVMMLLALCMVPLLLLLRKGSVPAEGGPRPMPE